jgi:Arc/MetJ-type ribon-helix-helix transcriptional regulator
MTLPRPLAHEVRRAVERGDYSEPSEVVGAALSAWIKRDSPPAKTEWRLREFVKEAEESGEEDGDLDLKGSWPRLEAL